jgi:hypothetical protein
MQALQTTVVNSSEPFRLKKDENGYERIVYSELLIPETPNAYSDYHTSTSVREFAYAFMIKGFFIDEEHDNVDISDKVQVVESWIAREGDPDFIEGAWVIGMYIGDDLIWDKVLGGELNGFSYEALVNFTPALIDAPIIRTVSGITEPDTMDGHTHEYFVLLDPLGTIIAGGTVEDDTDHTHLIRRHTFTDEASYHLHLFNYVAGQRD